MDFFVGTLAATPFTNRNAGQKLICFNGPNTCFFTEKDFTQGLGSDGVGVVWNLGNALVEEFLLTFLLVFSVLQRLFTQISIFRRWCASQIGLALSLIHSLLIPIDGASSIRPDLSFQLSGLGSPGAKGHLRAHVGLLSWAFGRCCSCSFEGSVHRALSVFSCVPYFA